MKGPDFTLSVALVEGKLSVLVNGNLVDDLSSVQVTATQQGFNISLGQFPSVTKAVGAEIERMLSSTGEVNSNGGMYL